MPRLVSATALAFALLLAAGAGLFALALEATPHIGLSRPLSHTDIARARQLLRRNDPRYLAPGTLHRVHVSEHDLNVALNYLAARYGARLLCAVRAQRLRVQGSVALPVAGRTRFLNIDWVLATAGAGVRTDSLRLGQLPVPAWLADRGLRLAMRRLFAKEQLPIAEQLLASLRLDAGELSFAYRWHPNLLRQLPAQLADAALQAAVTAYLDELGRYGPPRRGALTPLLNNLFRLAEQRSEDGDAVNENRALLLTLGTWAVGRGKHLLVPPDASETWLPRFRLTLDGRIDLAQHFLVSAAAAAAADSVLADALGLYKELADARGGSGFSFADLAADRAGTRLGSLAVASPRQARRLQQKLARPELAEATFMPSIHALPEGLQADALHARYGDPESVAFRAMDAEIAARIARLPLYAEQ